MNGRFLTEAVRLANRLARGALRHRGRATWLADSVIERDETWLPSVGTLGGDLASGTAGVGTFLASVAAATNERSLVRSIAAEALRNALVLADEPSRSNHLGWYEGSLGIAWAAIHGGRLLDMADLQDHGARLAARAVAAARHVRMDAKDAGLLGTPADLVNGLFAIEPCTEQLAASDLAERHCRTLAQAVLALGDESGSGIANPAGLARGWSGLGLVLAAWIAASDDALEPAAADKAFQAERSWYTPQAGWRAPSAHPWMDSPRELERSWCSGAAGIGIARIVGYVATQEAMLLAEAGAAIELVRRNMTVGDIADASLCHGAAGEIELLLVAGLLLKESAHVEAARAAGRKLIERAQVHGGYGTAHGPGTRNPSLLFGLAGTGLTLLRLHDPGLAMTQAVPPVLQALR